MNQNTHADLTHIKAFREERFGYHERIDVYVQHETRRNGIAKWAYLREPTFKQFEEADLGVNRAPSFRLFQDEAQALMDSLWDCGVRPTAGHGSAGQMAATEKHLEDMRKIAFAKISIP
jgi:hypothetical protein